MAIGILALLASAAVGAPPPAQVPPTPSANVISPLTVTAQPKDAPPADATVSVGDGAFAGAQEVSIWPAGALAAGASAWVTLTCQVDVHGLAETCRVAYENPPGKGFGAAALALRATFKVAPRQGPDGPQPGPMNIAVHFKPSATESNLRDLQAAGIPPEAGDKMSNLGHHELNARNLTVFDNPVATRRVTLMDWPAWTRAPSFDDLARAYPAKGGGVEGYAVAHCRVQPTGALTRCVVAKELPTGHDFGKAAVALAAQFTVSPQTMAAAPHGAPVEVDVPVRFPPPAEAADRTVRAPFWIAGADPQSLIRDFPAAVARPGSPGAQVGCEVGPDGTLAGCKIELTSPDGIDFDEAAVKFASRLRMNLWSAEAGPVLGGVVHLPVRLDLGDRQATR